MASTGQRNMVSCFKLRKTAIDCDRMHMVLIDYCIRTVTLVYLTHYYWFCATRQHHRRLYNGSDFPYHTDTRVGSKLDLPPAVSIASFGVLTLLFSLSGYARNGIL
jgi:hypothetical protein